MGKTNNQLGYTDPGIQEWRHSMVVNQLANSSLHHILWEATSTSFITRASPWKMPRSYSPSNWKIEGWNSRVSLCDPRHLLQHLFWCHCLWQSAWAPAEETVTLEEVLHPGRQFLGSICKPKLPFTASRCFQSCLHSQMWEIQSPRDMGSGRTEKRQTAEQQAGCWASALAVKYFKCHL